MKLLKNFLLVVAASLMITACGGGDTPKGVAEKFMKATMNFDFKEAKKYVAKQYVSVADEYIKKLDDPQTKASLEMVKSLMKDVKYEITNEKIAADGNTATVTVKATMMGQTKEEELPLVKEDGSWKIDKFEGLNK